MLLSFLQVRLNIHVHFINLITFNDNKESSVVMWYPYIPDRPSKNRKSIHKTIIKPSKTFSMVLTTVLS